MLVHPRRPLSCITLADRNAARRLLEESKLPVDDLDSAEISLWVIRDTLGQVAGCVGLEIHASHALLRSLAVAGQAETPD